MRRMDEDRTPARLEQRAEPTPRRRLRRRVHDRVVAGVCGGLADHFGVSMLVPRVAFAAAAIVVALLFLRAWLGFGPSAIYYDPRLDGLRTLTVTASAIAVLVYLALWVFVPAENQGTSAAGRLRHRLPPASGLRAWLGMLSLVGGGSVFGAQLGLWSVDVVWAFLLIGIGVLLFRRDAERRALDGGRSAVQPEAGVPAWEPSTPELPRERSPLGWLVLGVALLVVSGTAILQNLGAFELRLVRYPALALTVLGAGMVVGAWAGRARWLMLPALLLVPVVLLASLVRVPLVGGVGDRRVDPGSDILPEYRTVLGSIYLDLDALRLTDMDRTIRASAAFGTINVVVPFDAHVRATGRAGLGTVQVGPHPLETGAEVELDTTWEPRFGDGATITLDLATGIGDIWVYRRDPTRRDLRELGIKLSDRELRELGIRPPRSDR